MSPPVRVVKLLKMMLSGEAGTYIQFIIAYSAGNKYTVPGFGLFRHSQKPSI